MAAEPKPQRDVTEDLLAAITRACAKQHRSIDWMTVNCMRGPSGAEDLVISGIKLKVLTMHCSRAANPHHWDLQDLLLRTIGILMAVDPRVTWVDNRHHHHVQMLIPAEWGQTHQSCTLDYAHHFALCLRQTAQYKRAHNQLMRDLVLGKIMSADDAVDATWWKALALR